MLRKILKIVLVTSLVFASINVSVIENTNIAFAAEQGVYEKGGSCIDASTANQGFVKVKQTGVSAKLKVQVIKDGKSYNYNLNNNGNYEIFPLQMGNGNYTITIMQNTSGTKYIQLFAASVSATLVNEFEPFVHPSQFVNYNSNSVAVKKAAELCSGKATDVDKVKTVYEYVVNNITYDKNTAALVQSGYVPNIDNTLNKKQGICFDYASLMAAMLRSQGIPTKVIIGVVAPNQINHAWNEVYIKGVGWISVGISANGSSWERMDSTFAASKNEDIEKYIGNNSNYTALKVY